MEDLEMEPMDTTLENVTHGCRVNVTRHSQQDALEFIVEGVLSSLVAAVGICGNLASTAVLSRPEFKETFHKLLICLTLVDSVFILCATTTSWIRIARPLDVDSENNVEWESLHLLFLLCIAVGNCARDTSLLVTVTISIERYFGICYPIQSRVRGRRRVAIYLVPVLVFSFLFNLPKFADLNWVLSKDPFYNRVYLQYVEMSVTVLSPLLLLLAFNVRIIYAVRTNSLRANVHTSHEQREQYLTFILISIVAVFLLCHSLKFFLLFYKELDIAGTLLHYRCIAMDLEASFPAWMDVISHFSHFLLILNSSLNFFIYCFVGSKFRKGLRAAVVSGCLRNSVVRFHSEVTNSSDRTYGRSQITELSMMLPRDRLRSSQSSYTSQTPPQSAQIHTVTLTTPLV